MYFAYGQDDIVGICEMPDAASAAAASLAVSSSGTVNVHMTPLLTADDLDAASGIVSGASYRAPGS